jgi:NAD(P)H-dependent FMN reductase
VEHFLNAVRGSQGLIIGTPVYYGMFSAALKNALEFIDLTANDTSPLLSGKVLALICVAGDYPSSSALNALYCSCRPLRPWLLPTAVSLTSKDLVVKEGSLVDENIGKRLRDLGKDVAHSVQTIARCSLEPQKR